MGSQASKPGETTIHEKAVLERLQSLQVEDDYVQVSGDAEKTIGPLIREAQGLPLHVLEAWQERILKDPKNKSVNRPTSHPTHNTKTDAHIL